MDCVQACGVIIEFTRWFLAIGGSKPNPPDAVCDAHRVTAHGGNHPIYAPE
jgi:hypothetical protein